MADAERESNARPAEQIASNPAGRSNANERRRGRFHPFPDAKTAKDAGDSPSRRTTNPGYSHSRTAAEIDTDASVAAGRRGEPSALKERAEKSDPNLIPFWVTL